MIKRFLDFLRSVTSRGNGQVVPAPESSPGRPSPVTQEAIARLIGASPRDMALYLQALTHRSHLRGQPESHLYSNERLEFLGDAVLGFVIAEHLYRSFPEKDEGYLTRLRAKLVSGQALARVARAIDLGTLLILSDNMEQAGGRTNTTIIADAFEAVIGAIYLDQGLEAARRFIFRTIVDPIDLADLAERHDNYKSLLLEYAQAQGWPQPQYRLTSEEGPSHDRIFTVEVHLHDGPRGQGTAGSKKKAEQLAAREALEHLREEIEASTNGEV